MRLNARTAAALGLLAVLVALAGCGSLGGPVDEKKLSGNATYDWDTNARTSFDVSRSQYEVVIRVNESVLSGKNSTELRVYRRDSLGTEQAVSVEALTFRYPNGTVVNATAFEVTKTGKRTVIVPPQQNGSIAFTAHRESGKRFSVPVFVAGSYEMTLPKRARVGIPLLSQVSPPADSKRVANDRMTLRWKSVERGPIVARYYLQRDLLLFGGLFAVLAVVGIGGALYYLKQIRTLRKRREEIGLDVETEDDDLDDRGPPPGMR